MPQRFRIRVGEREHDVSVEFRAEAESYRVNVDGQVREVIPAPDDIALVRDPADGHQLAVTLDGNGRPSAATLGGRSVEVAVRSAEEAALEDALSMGRHDVGGVLKAPMPGRVVKVLVGVGDSVERGSPILIIEAMKMENELPAPSSGRVVSLNAAPGDTVEAGAVLCEIVPHDHAAPSP